LIALFQFYQSLKGFENFEIERNMNFEPFRFGYLIFFKKKLKICRAESVFDEFLWNI